jgi:hypothetical protein
VRSKNVNGDSDWSAEEDAVTPSAGTTTGQGLDIPGNLDANDASDAAASMLKLTWAGVTKANSYEILGWDGTSWDPVPLGDSPATIAEVVKNLSLTISAIGDEDLDPATTYYFVIRARTITTGDDDILHNTGDIEVETSDWSEPFSGTTRSHKPLVPTALSVTPRTETSIWLSWTHADGEGTANPPTGDATSYTVEWRRGSSSDTINVEGRTSSLHMNLSAGTDYYYRVRANNAGGSSQWYPNPETGTATGDTDIATCTDTDLTNDVAGCAEIEKKGTTSATALMPPSNIMPEAVTSESIKLSWDKVTGATGYEIQRWNGTAWEILPADGTAGGGGDLVAGGTTTFIHTGITASDDDAPDAGEHATEYYVIRTVSQGGVVSTWSSLVVGTTEPSPPEVVPVLRLVPTGQTSVRLTWEEVTGATGYKVEYLEKAAEVADFENDRIVKQSFTEGASPTYKTHTGLKVGTRYSYRIIPMLADKAMTTPSAVVQVVTKPATPVLSGSGTTATTVELTFPQVMLDGDHLGVIGDYQIQRRTTGGLWSDDIGPTLTLVANTCTTDNEVACKFTDAPTTDPLEAGTTYFYRIRVAKDALTPSVSANAPGSSGNDLTSYWRQIRVRTPSN